MLAIWDEEIEKGESCDGLSSEKHTFNERAVKQ
jgi:hypothetical protein